MKISSFPFFTESCCMDSNSLSTSTFLSSFFIASRFFRFSSLIFSNSSKVISCQFKQMQKCLKILFWGGQNIKNRRVQYGSKWLTDIRHPLVFIKYGNDASICRHMATKHKRTIFQITVVLFWMISILCQIGLPISY